MSGWYINEISKITEVSVRTLHYYDKLGLLKPSIRLPNGYRLYSETDLLKLQQILALKFFGFTLSNIKLILKNELSILDHFRIQSKILEERAHHLTRVNDILKELIVNCSESQPITLSIVLKLMGEYRMVTELEKSWAGKIFTKDELKKFPDLFSTQDLKLFKSLKTNWPESEQIEFRKKWTELMQSVLNNLNEDPFGETGKRIGEHWMDLVNKIYGNEYKLRNTIWDAYRNGKVIGSDVFPRQGMIWIENAISAYYYEKAASILMEISENLKQDSQTSDILNYKKIWNDFIDEKMCVNVTDNEFIDNCLNLASLNIDVKTKNNLENLLFSKRADF